MENKIIRLLKKHDEQGLFLLIDNYGKLVRYIIRNIIGDNESEIEECANDIYMKIWTNIDKYDYSISSFKRYLTVISRNTAISRLRKISKNSEHIKYGELSEIAMDYVDIKSDIEEQIVKKEEMEIVIQLIKKLKSTDRELFERKFFYMQTANDIAKDMGLTVGAVESRIYRIRDKIKKEYIHNSKIQGKGISLWTSIF